MDRTTLRGGRVIDPSQGIDGPFDLTIEGDRIVVARTGRHGSAARAAGASRMSPDSWSRPA